MPCSSSQTEKDSSPVRRAVILECTNSTRPTGSTRPSIDYCSIEIKMGSRRADGRREQQFRNLHFQMGVDHTVDGSCLYKQGLTEVIALVEGPRAVIYAFSPRKPSKSA